MPSTQSTVTEIFTRVLPSERIKLRAGESRSVTVSIPERAFTSVDENGTRKCFSDSFTLYAGTHQPDKLSAVLSSTECAVTEIKF